MGGVLLNCDELKVRRLFHAVISSTTFSYISVVYLPNLWSMGMVSWLVWLFVFY